MKKPNPNPPNALREQAEDILKSRLSKTGMPLSEAEISKLIYELQVSQIELELQNKELLPYKEQNTTLENKQINILDLIDFEEVNKLLEGFNQSTGFVTAILDLEGNVLSRSGWRQICNEFHRINHETSNRCTISDTVLANKMAEGEKYHFYECLNGLVDVAVPITINGQHIANLFSGQFFFEEPNLTFFKKQAEKYGFNEEKYLAALENVPVVSKEKVKVAMDFMLNMTQLISEITYQKLEQIQLNEALKKSEERSRNALDHLLEGCQIIGFDWKYIYLNHTAEIHNKRPNAELIGNRYMDLWPGIEETEVFEVIKQTLETRVPTHLENKFFFPDGSLGWFDLSIQPVPEGVFILSIDITERKKTESSLIESHKLFDILFSTSPSAIVLSDLTAGALVDANKSFLDLIGYELKEAVGKTSLELGILSNKKLREQKLDKVKEGKTDTNFEVEIKRKSGEIRFCLGSVEPISINGENFALSSFIDITERKAAETALLKSEEKYRLIADNSDDWIYWVAPDGHLPYVSPACERVTGYSPEEFTNQPELIHDIVFEPDKIKLSQHTKISRLDDTPHNLEFRIVTKSGEIRWINHSCSPIFNDDGEYLGRRGTNRNITERKLTEEQLRESELRFSKLYEDGPFGMAMVDSEFKFKKVNPAFSFMMGYTEKELREMTFKNITHPEDLSKDLHNVLKLINKEISVFKTEKRYIRKDGQEIWGSLTVTANFNDDGNFIYNLAILEDITRRKQAEEDLRKSKQLLAETESIGKVGGWEFNIDTKEQTWTDEVYRIHEVDLDFKQNVDKGINFYAPASRPIIEKAVQRVIEFGEPFDVELEIITAKGNLRSVHSIGKADLEHRRVYGFFQDITERKHAEKELKQLSDRISTATSASQVGIWDWDIANNKLLWDEQMYILYGVKKDEFTAAYEAWVNGLHPDDREFGTRQTQLALSGEKEYDTEFRVVWPDGTIRYCKAKGEVFRDERGEPIRMVGVNYDITDRKLIENALKENEEYLKLGYDTADLGVWKNDMNTMTVEFDERARIHYGFEESVVTLSDVIIRIHPDDVGRLSAEIEKATAPTGTGRYSTEYRVIHPDGSVHWLYIGVRVTFDGEGENRRSVMGYGTSLDITKRKLAEEKIREKDQEFRKLSANVPDLLFQFTRSPDGSYFVPIASEGIRNIFGCAPEDVINDFTPIGRVIHPEDAERVIRDIEYSAEHMTYFTCEFRVQIPGREIQWIYSKSTPERLPDGSITWYGFNTDITHKKLAEEALRESEEKFRNLIESLPLPVTYVSNQGEIAFRNDRFLQVIGYTHEEVPTVNEWWGKAYPDEKYQKQVTQQWASAVEKAKITNSDIEPIEYNITCKDGIERTMIVSGIIIDDNLLITFIDITDRKKAEEEIRKLNETLEKRVEERTAQLQEANRELEAFSYSVSHDLRAPLRHINGFVDLLTENYTDLLPEKGKHYLDVIVSSSRHMGSLIDDLLQFSRTGRQELQKSNLNMNDVLLDVLKQVQHDSEKRNIEWNLAVLPGIKGDQSLLRMAWYNLLSNAVKFTKAKDPAEIQIGFTEDRKEYTFFVRDNGAGFDMRFAHKLFGVFQRLHTTKEFEGTGIGLANVRRIILKHGGRTWAESQINEGATFYFTLPKK